MPFIRPRSNENRDGFDAETLRKLLKSGPLDAGDIPSKAGLADLIDHELAIMIVMNQELGMYAATGLGQQFFINHFGGSTLAEALARYEK